MSERIAFQVPLPSRELRSNNRSHWAAKVKAKQAYSLQVLMYAIDAEPPYPEQILQRRWKRARVTFTWRACRLPDQSNVLPNCKALLDILCTAPPEKPGTKHPNRTTYLGILEDDKHVEAVGKVERVRHRADEGVLVEVERL